MCTKNSTHQNCHAYFKILSTRLEWIPSHKKLYIACLLYKYHLYVWVPEIVVHRNISDANSSQAVKFLLTIPVISSELDQFSQKKLWPYWQILWATIPRILRHKCQGNEVRYQVFKHLPTFKPSARNSKLASQQKCWTMSHSESRKQPNKFTNKQLLFFYLFIICWVSLQPLSFWPFASCLYLIQQASR